MHELDLSLIRTDPGTQARARLDMGTVAEYEEAIEENGRAWPFPPVIVYHDGTVHWLADGFHRVAAARRMLLETAPADMREGTRRDAILFATGANADHGLKRSPTDKRNAVRILLADEEWGQWSDREIARQCRVSHPFVAKVRQEVTGNVSSERVYVNRHGQTAVMETEKIGTNGGGEEARRANWIKVARSMVDICQDYAKTRDYVPEGDGQNHADFHLLAHLRDEYGDQNDLVTMQKKLRQMTIEEIREVLRRYEDYAEDARANVSRWLNQQISKKPTAVPESEKPITRQGIMYRCRWWKCSSGEKFTVPESTMTCTNCGALHTKGIAGLQLAPGERERLERVGELAARLDAIDAELEADYTAVLSEPETPIQTHDTIPAAGYARLNVHANAMAIAMSDLANANTTSYSRPVGEWVVSIRRAAAAPSAEDLNLLTAVTPVYTALLAANGGQRRKAAAYLKNMGTDEPEEIAALFRELSRFVNTFKE